MLHDYNYVCSAFQSIMNVVFTITMFILLCSFFQEHHYHKMPKEMQTIMGEPPDEYLSYFTSKFPSLLMQTYNLAMQFNCDVLSKYFKYKSKYYAEMIEPCI